MHARPARGALGRAPPSTRTSSPHGRGDDLLVMTFSEFGRRVDENSSDGTDHGAAAPLFVLGNSVQGGIYGDHPSLRPRGRRPDPRIDFRAVYTTVLRHWLDVDPEPVLGGRFEDLGFLRAPAAKRARLVMRLLSPPPLLFMEMSSPFCSATLMLLISTRSSGQSLVSVTTLDNWRRSSSDHLAKDRILPVQARHVSQGKIELGAVALAARVSLSLRRAIATEPETCAAGLELAGDGVFLRQAPFLPRAIILAGGVTGLHEVVVHRAMEGWPL